MNRLETVITAGAAIVLLAPAQAKAIERNMHSTEFAEPGYNSTLEVKLHCESKDDTCLRILEGAMGAAITMQSAYVVNFQPPLFCLDSNPTIEDFRDIFLKYVQKVSSNIDEDDVLNSQFSVALLTAVTKAFPCKHVNPDAQNAPAVPQKQP